MDPVALFLLTVAGIFIVGIIGEVVFDKTNVPDVVWLIVVGILLGPVTGVVERSMLETLAPYFGAVTLVIVLFQGGHSLQLSELSRSALRGTVLAIFAFCTAAAMVAVATMLAAKAGLLPPSWTWLHGLTAGAILGGTSSVVIMPAMAKAGLSGRLSNLLCLESAVTDVLCVVATVACIELAVSGSTDPSTSVAALGRSFGIGLGMGLMTGLVGLLFLRLLLRSEYAYPFTLAVLLVLYVVVDGMGGSAALAVLTMAVLLGNAKQMQGLFGLTADARLSKGVKTVHHQLTFIVKSFFFTFIGAMLAPPWGLLLLGVGLGVLLLIARVPAVYAATVGAKMGRPAKAIVSATLPRGMAAGVLAMMPSYAGMEGTAQLPTVVFAAVLTTIVLFAVGFPLARRRLGPEDLAQGDPPAPPPRVVPDAPVPPAEASQPVVPAVAAVAPLAPQQSSPLPDMHWS